MKILIGVIAALVVALGLTGWWLKSTLESKATIAEQLAGVQGQLKTSEDQNKGLAGRFDSLDLALKDMGAAQQQNQLVLANRLATIKNIVQEPGDSNESISCLDQRVPAQLDRGLR